MSTGLPPYKSHANQSHTRRAKTRVRRPRSPVRPPGLQETHRASRGSRGHVGGAANNFAARPHETKLASVKEGTSRLLSSFSVLFFFFFVFNGASSAVSLCRWLIRQEIRKRAGTASMEGKENSESVPRILLADDARLG